MNVTLAVFSQLSDALGKPRDDFHLLRAMLRLSKLNPEAIDGWSAIGFISGGDDIWKTTLEATTEIQLPYEQVSRSLQEKFDQILREAGRDTEE